MVDRGLVLGGIEDLDCGTTDVLVFILDKLEHRIHDFRTADFPQRVAGPGADPPVVVLDRLEQVLDRIGIADFIEHLNGRSSRILGLVLQRGNQELDGLRVVDLYHDVDGLVLNFEVRVPKQPADLLDVDIAVTVCERVQRGASNHLVGVAERHFQGPVDVRMLEFCQQVDQVNLDQRVFATHAGNKVRHHVLGHDFFNNAEKRPLLLGTHLVGALQHIMNIQRVLVNLENLDEGGLRDLGVLKETEQLVRIVVVAARQGPRRPGYNAFAAVCKTFFVELEGLVGDLAGQNVDVQHRVVTITHRQRIDRFGNDLGPEFFEALGQLLRGARVCVRLAGQLADQLISAKAREEAHDTRSAGWALQRLICESDERKSRPCNARIPACELSCAGNCKTFISRFAQAHANDGSPAVPDRTRSRFHTDPSESLCHSIHGANLSSGQTKYR